MEYGYLMNETKCLSCQAEATWKATGEWASDQARKHWSMFGCTCDPADEANAVAFVKLVTR